MCFSLSLEQQLLIVRLGETAWKTNTRNYSMAPLHLVCNPNCKAGGLKTMIYSIVYCITRSFDLSPDSK